MEGLNLEDLNFTDINSLNLFDENGEKVKEESINNEGSNNPGEEQNNTPNNLEENINTDGDGSGDSGQESVANQGKETNQVQAGKTDNGEGGDSSSPKMNETEQLYSNLAAEFKAKGVLPGLDDVTKIKSLEDINKALENEVTSRLDNKQSVISDAISAGAPLDEVSEKVNAIEKLKSINPEFIEDDSNIEFRKTAIVQDFIDKGYGEERAQTLAQRSIDAGTDVEDAKFAIKNIIASEEKSLSSIIEKAKSDEEKSLNNIKDYISSTPEVIPGIKLTDSQKDELYSQITTSVDSNKNNAFMVAQKKDPIGSRIKLEALFYLTKGLTDFSLFGAATETKVANNIENLLRGAKFTEEGKVQTQIKDNNSSFVLSDLKDLEIE